MTRNRRLELAARLRLPRANHLREDIGSTLVTVLVIMLVLTIGGLAIAGIVRNTSGTLMGTTNEMRAQAAVDAGIAEIVTRMERGDYNACATETVSDPVLLTDAEGNPIPEAEPAFTDVEGDPSYSYNFFCSAGIATLNVKATVGDSTASRGTEYAYDVQHAVRSPALVTKNSTNIGAFSGIGAADPVNHPADLWIIPETGGSGNFNCAVAGGLSGSVYVENGSISATAACNIAGSMVASGNITLTAAVSAGGDVISQNGKVSLTAGVTVKGSVYAKGDITLAAGAFVTGDVVSETGKVTFLGGATVGGSVYAHKNITAIALVSVAGNAVSETGNVSTFLATIRGDRVANSGEPTPEVPEMTYQPKWRSVTNADIDALYAPGGGFARVQWNGDCKIDRHFLGLPSSHAMARMNNYTQPTIIDARHCTDGVEVRRIITSLISPLRMYLRNDIMIVAPSFNWQGVRFSSSSGSGHKLWFISPDENCRDSDFGIPLHGAEIDSSITPMLYTNCKANFHLLGAGRWNGSMSVADFGGLPSFTYRPSGFPGWDEEILDSAEGDVEQWDLTRARALD